ncbi:MAG: ion channel [Syntrophotaleaceae bacterium]
MIWPALLAGTLMILVSIVDIFLTVLYARKGSGLLSPLMTRWFWRAVKILSQPLGSSRGTALTFVGPALVIVLAATWALLLLFGFALIFWPCLGATLQAGKGATSTDFLTAVYYSGFCLTTLGLGDIAPQSGLVRLLTVAEAALGFSFFTLTITYFLSVFSALLRRNAFSSLVHQKTGLSGKSAFLVVGLLSKSSLGETGPHLRELAAGVADILESDHFYPVLHFFRFHGRHYALPWTLAILLDTVSLLRTLPLTAYQEIELEVCQLETACRELLRQLSEDFIGRQAAGGNGFSTDTVSLWHGHYSEVLRAVQSRGALSEEGTPGGEEYVQSRSEWQAELEELCHAMAFDAEDIL